MHPLLQSIPGEKRQSLFWIFLALTIFITIILTRVGTPLITPAAPFGMVSFELAGSIEQVNRILASWNQVAQIRAGFSLGFDYVYMLVYPMAIALACLWSMEVLRVRSWPFAGIGRWAARGLILAAMLDALENISLILLLFGYRQTFLPQMAWLFASLKFLLIFFGLVYALLGFFVYCVVRKPNGKQSTLGEQPS